VNWPTSLQEELAACEGEIPRGFASEVGRKGGICDESGQVPSPPLWIGHADAALDSNATSRAVVAVGLRTASPFADIDDPGAAGPQIYSRARLLRLRAAHGTTHPGAKLRCRRPTGRPRRCRQDPTGDGYAEGLTDA